MDKDLFYKYINNQCSSEDIDKSFDLFGKRQIGNSKEKELYRNYWDSLGDENSQDKVLAKRVLDRIHHTINLNKSEQTRKSRTLFFPRQKKSIRLLSRAAAVLLIPILTIFIYTHFLQPELYALLNMAPNYEIISPPGARTQFTLPDGTRVWLNQGSRLKYPHHFIGETRTVWLTGEGYFDVTKDKAKPFIVESNGMQVKALGTSFNVKAYVDDVDFETTLESGRVAILRNGNKRSTSICEMAPGEHFTFNDETHKYSLSRVNPEKYVSWKDGKLMFKDDDLVEVTERLSRWFNVRVTIADQELRALAYTATFIDETIEQVMEMMEIVTPISYTIVNRKKMPDGSFSEKEVIISKKGGKPE